MEACSWDKIEQMVSYFEFCVLGPRYILAGHRHLKLTPSEGLLRTTVVGFMAPELAANILSRLPHGAANDAISSIQ